LAVEHRIKRREWSGEAGFVLLCNEMNEMNEMILGALNVG
jgi:hypothetical protein